MVLATAERGGEEKVDHRPAAAAVVDVESGSLYSSSSSVVDRQDSLFREAVTGGHHRGAGGHSHDHVRTVPAYYFPQIIIQYTNKRGF